MTNKNSLTARVQKPTFSNFITATGMKAKINAILGGKKGDQFIAAIVSAVSTNPALQECDHATIFSAALNGAALNLSPSPQLGQFYFVPFNDNKNRRKVAQFQIGYKGYIQLAIRSGNYKKLNVAAIKEGELIKFDALSEDIEVRLIDDDEQREKAKTIGYYAMFEYINGFKKALYWSKAKMQAHALKYSKGYAAKKGYTFWEKDFDGMAYKTMLRQLISKWGIMSVEMQLAYERDNAVINEDGGIDYVDNDANDNSVNAPQIDTVEKKIEAPETAEEVETPAIEFGEGAKQRAVEENFFD
jgi:recombination protein RecT